MNRQPAHRSTGRARPKPVLIYDGECGFCQRSVEIGKRITGDRVHYEPSSRVPTGLPGIPPEAFARSVQWVGSDGSTCSGAEAVFSALATASWLGKFALFSYRRIPLVARLTESVYSWVAAHRKWFSCGR